MNNRFSDAELAMWSCSNAANYMEMSHAEIVLVGDGQCFTWRFYKSSAVFSHLAYLARMVPDLVIMMKGHHEQQLSDPERANAAEVKLSIVRGMRKFWSRRVVARKLPFVAQSLAQAAKSLR